SKHAHPAKRLAGPQIVESAIDVVEADAAGDQFIELEPAVEIGLRQQREIARRPGAAITRSADALFTPQAARAEAHIICDVDLAEPDDLTDRPHWSRRETKC